MQNLRATILAAASAVLLALALAVAPAAWGAESAPYRTGEPPFPGAVTLGQAAAAHASAHATTTRTTTRTAKPAVGGTGYYLVLDSLYTGTPGQCLDADVNNGANGTKVQVWTCNGTLQQQWISWSDNTIESVKFRGMCLDADLNGGGANGTRVQLWACNGSTQQQWVTRINDLAIYNVRFLNNTNTVLDRDVTVPGNGARVQLWAKNYQSQQWWQPGYA